jgi:hypothetical protein
VGRKVSMNIDEVIHEMNDDIDDITAEVAMVLAEICESRDIDTEEAEITMPSLRFRKIFRMFKLRDSR